MPCSHTITPDMLMARIGTPDGPRLLDLRIDADIAADPHLIPGARRMAHERLTAEAAGLAGRETVMICQKGRKISQGAAALLRSHGASSPVLDGGTEAWRAHGLPRLRLSDLPESDLWVTHETPGIGDLAAGWLVTRFVSETARILFVPKAEVRAVADRYRAHPLPQGADGTLAGAAERLGLACPALTGLSDRLPDALAPYMQGLDRRHPEPAARLSAALPLFDLLYANARGVAA